MTLADAQATTVAAMIQLAELHAGEQWDADTARKQAAYQAMLNDDSIMREVMAEAGDPIEGDSE